MRAQRVLHRQLMEPEEPAHLIHFRFTGLEQAQPHEAALVAPGRCFLQRHRTIVEPVAVLVVTTVDDHLGNSLCEGDLTLDVNRYKPVAAETRIAQIRARWE